MRLPILNMAYALALCSDAWNIDIERPRFSGDWSGQFKSWHFICWHHHFFTCIEVAHGQRSTGRNDNVHKEIEEEFWNYSNVLGNNNQSKSLKSKVSEKVCLDSEQLIEGNTKYKMEREYLLPWRNRQRKKKELDLEKKRAWPGVEPGTTRRNILLKGDRSFDIR